MCINLVLILTCMQAIIHRCWVYHIAGAKMAAEQIIELAHFEHFICLLLPHFGYFLLY